MVWFGVKHLNTRRDRIDLGRVRPTSLVKWLGAEWWSYRAGASYSRGFVGTWNHGMIGTDWSLSSRPSSPSMNSTFEETSATHRENSIPIGLLTKTRLASLNKLSYTRLVGLWCVGGWLSLTLEVENLNKSAVTSITLIANRIDAHLTVTRVAIAQLGSCPGRRHRD